MISIDFSRRCHRLVRERGLARGIADDLRQVGDESMLSQLESATDAEIRQLNQLYRARQLSASSVATRLGRRR